jgi:hypothetical protein
MRDKKDSLGIEENIGNVLGIVVGASRRYTVPTIAVGRSEAGRKSRVSNCWNRAVSKIFILQIRCAKRSWSLALDVPICGVYKSRFSPRGVRESSG